MGPWLRWLSWSLGRGSSPASAVLPLWGPRACIQNVCSAVGSSKAWMRKEEGWGSGPVKTATALEMTNPSTDVLNSMQGTRKHTKKLILRCLLQVSYKELLSELCPVKGRRRKQYGNEFSDCLKCSWKPQGVLDYCRWLQYHSFIFSHLFILHSITVDSELWISGGNITLHGAPVHDKAP